MSAAATVPRELAQHGIVAWLVTTDHKRIGILYMVTSLGFFAAAGFMADVMRLQLAAPLQSLVSAHTYNQMFTLHGTAMIFLFVAPFGFGIANFLIPLQIGAPDMAFPRLNAYSYWLFLLGGLTVFAGLASAGGAAAAGWTSYAPLSDAMIATGAGQDMWILGLTMTSISGIVTAINFLATPILFRAPGMSMWRMPVFVWDMIATALLVLMAFPALTAVLAMLLLERHAGAKFFVAGSGGDAILYQHVFWFFGHPEVYVMILPMFGVVTEIFGVFSRKPVFGYSGLVLSAFGIAGLSMGVWAHHMFTTGAVDDPFFSAMSLLIAVPTGIKFFNWIGTMWRGAISFETPMLFAVGFLLNFLIGGITGVMVASPPIDFHVEDSYFLIAHFHYVLGGGSMFAIFAALYFWFPKIFGVKLNETLGRINFWTMFVGFNLTFFPMHFLGVMGMPRRVYTYADLPGWHELNLIASIGTLIITISVAVFVWNVIASRLARTPLPDDPWEGGYSLEWATSSPPPEFNFKSLPPIRSQRPAFDLHHPELAHTSPK
ncbi:MAG: cbb3-type cytochrome c oxidase subunit I [Candidatus Eremiobacteraeota bacterium]|nr:cbb3-type cytochrome c oxidase subunit I [Candidatus Eremiobacteraeota bacterium]